MNRKSFLFTVFSSILIPIAKAFGSKSEIPHPQAGHKYYLVQWAHGQGLNKVYLEEHQINYLNKLTTTQGVFADKAKFAVLPKFSDDPYPLLKRINAGERFDKEFFVCQTR